MAEREVAPHAAEIDRTDAFPRRLWPVFGSLGILGPTVPAANGGAGLGFLEHLVIVEELSRASASVGLSYAAHSNLCVHNLWANGTAEQRARWLPALLSGAHVGALAMSEADAGSDVLGSMRARAERVHGGWLASGSKMWITNGPEADVLVVYLRTDPEAPVSRSISAFVVERGMDGLTASPVLDKLGMRGSATAELVFDRCFIPDENLLGEAGDGVRVLMSGLDTERLVLCGGPIGIMQAALDLVLPYVRERRQFGVPIGTFELMQAKVADMYTALQSSRGFAYRVAVDADAGGGCSSADAAAALLHGSERAVEVALEAIQALGAAGYVSDSAAGRLLRDAKLYTIGAGTNEIRRMLVGRALIGGVE